MPELCVYQLWIVVHNVQALLALAFSFMIADKRIVGKHE
jgi:hypothetical protein